MWVTKRAGYPARLFRVGLAEEQLKPCLATPEDPFGNLNCGADLVPTGGHLHALQTRVVVFGRQGIWRRAQGTPPVARAACRVGCGAVRSLRRVDPPGRAVGSGP